MPVTYEFPRPVLAVDAVVFALSPEGWRVLLIQRKKDPGQGKWAFPGGYFDMTDKSVEHAACRELREETGLDVPLDDMEQLRVYSRPRRDPRDRVVSVAHCTILGASPAVPGTPPEVKGADDAADARWFLVEDVQNDGVELAFDHDQIFADACSEVGIG
jgi:8-oxo-dGTP diphosphatase